MKEKSSKKRKSKKQDLNNLIVKDNHRRKIFSKIFYSHVVFTLFLILIQIFVFVAFCIWLNPHIEFYYGFSILITTGFMVYLSNCHGKNEFKIAWLVPVAIFPLFGVGAYLMYHLNLGGYFYKKRYQNHIKTMKKQEVDASDAKQLLKKNPEVEDIGNFLLSTGDFYPHENNKLTYYPNGESFLPVFLEALKSAKKFIFIEFFIIDVDESWSAILKILEEKMKEGEEVRLLYDGVGSVAASSRAYKKYLREKGLNFHTFFPLVPFFSTQMNNRDHRKIVVIDGKVGFTGGLNISNQYFNKGKNRFPYWKDNEVMIEGSGIENLTAMFLQTWNLQTKGEEDYKKYLALPYEKYDEKGIIIPYGDDPYNNLDIAEDLYIYLINKATKNLCITTPYVIIDNQLYSALIFAVRRGVKVQIIVPSTWDHFVTFCIGRTYLKDLIDNGVEIYLYKKGFIHAKTFICDGKYATVGSVNLDYRSLYYHFECGCFMYDVPAVKNIEQDFVDTLANSEILTQEGYKKIPAIQRGIGRFLKICSPLM